MWDVKMEDFSFKSLNLKWKIGLIYQDRCQKIWGAMSAKMLEINKLNNIKNTLYNKKREI